MATEKVVIDKAYIEAIAGAIRENTGSSAKLSLSDIARIIPTLKDTSLDFVRGTLTAYSNANLTEIRPYCFAGIQALTSLDTPLVATIGEAAFAYTGLASVSLPKVTAIPDRAFLGSKISDASDLIARATSIGAEAFKDSQLAGDITCTLPKEVADAFTNTKIQSLTVTLAQSLYFYVALQLVKDCKQLQRIKIKNCGYITGANYDLGLTGLQKVWISKEAAKKGIFGPPFQKQTSITALDIYMEDSTKPTSYGWDKTDITQLASGNATLHYGVTEEAFDQL